LNESSYNESLVERLNSKMKEYLFFCKILNQGNPVSDKEKVLPTPKTQNERTSLGARQNRRSIKEMLSASPVRKSPETKPIRKSKRDLHSNENITEKQIPPKEEPVKLTESHTFENMEIYSHGPAFDDNMSQVNSMMLGSEAVLRGTKNLNVSKYFWRPRFLGSGLTTGMVFNAPQ